MSSSEDDVRALRSERKQSSTSLELDDRSNLDEVAYTNCRMELLPCFHDATTRKKAEVLLENAAEGCYLIRTSTDAGHYSVSVRTVKSVKHFQINFDGERYSFGHTLFWSPFLIWEHLQQRPILECDEGVKVRLLHPYLNERKTSLVPQTDSTYSTVSKHYIAGLEQPVKPQKTKPGRRKSNDKNGTLGSSIINSMEGQMYKRKDGKTWQRRWCILKANYLLYKKDEKAAKARKELDLSQALYIQDDYAETEKKNCFRIIFPKVTYMFSADSAEDKQVWFENIQRQIDAYRGLNRD